MLIDWLRRERFLAVVGTASERNHDYLRSLRANPLRIRIVFGVRYSVYTAPV
jgi:hypothetical protein